MEMDLERAKRLMPKPNLFLDRAMIPRRQSGVNLPLPFFPGQGPAQPAEISSGTLAVSWNVDAAKARACDPNFREHTLEHLNACCRLLAEIKEMYGERVERLKLQDVKYSDELKLQLDRATGPFNILNSKWKTETEKTFDLFDSQWDATIQTLHRTLQEGVYFRGIEESVISELEKETEFDFVPSVKMINREFGSFNSEHSTSADSEDSEAPYEKYLKYHNMASKSSSALSEALGSDSELNNLPHGLNSATLKEFNKRSAVAREVQVVDLTDSNVEDANSSSLEFGKVDTMCIVMHKEIDQASLYWGRLENACTEMQVCITAHRREALDRLAKETKKGEEKYREDEEKYKKYLEADNISIASKVARKTPWLMLGVVGLGKVIWDECSNKAEKSAMDAKLMLKGQNLNELRDKVDDIDKFLTKVTKKFVELRKLVVHYRAWYGFVKYDFGCLREDWINFRTAWKTMKAEEGDDSDVRQKLKEVKGSAITYLDTAAKFYLNRTKLQARASDGT